MASSYINLSSNQPKYCSGRIDWQSTAYPSGCYSLLNAQVYVILNGWGIQGTGSGSWQENGTTVETFSPKVNVAYGGTGTTHVYTKNGTRVNHNTSSGNGSISLGCSMAFSFAGINYVSGSGTANMDWIPRYATSNQSLSSKTLNTITMNWSSDNTCDYIWYSIDNGSTWTGIDISDGTSGSYTITGLEPATTYNIKTRVRRRDSQLTTDSSALSVTTYDIAKITEVPANITIGNSLTVKFSNPGGADIQLGIYTNDGDEICAYRNATESPYVFRFTLEEIMNMYKKIPNDTTIILKIYAKTTQNNKSYNHYADVVFRIDEVANKPTFDSTLSCEDINLKTLALTGNKNKFLLGYSKALITISNAAVAKNESTISKYNITDGVTLVNPVETTAPFTGTIDPINGTIVEAQVVDSRGLTNSITRELDVIEYKTPLINATTNLKRVGGVGTSVNFNFSGYIWNETFGSVHNSIKSFKYKVLPETTTNWDSVEWINIDSSKYTLAADGTITNTENAILPNFVVGTEYTVRFYIEDELNTSILEVNVGSGSPITAYNKTKKLMGVGKIPERTLPEGSIDAKGQVWQEGVQVMNQSSTYTGDLNDINTTSLYYCDTCANSPEGVKNGYLFTQVRNSKYAYQQYTTWNRDAKYERHKNDGVWGDWEESSSSGESAELKLNIGKMIWLTKTSNQVISANIQTQIIYDKTFYNDSEGLLVSQSGGITIGPGVSKILVEGQYRDTGDRGKYIYILKNGEREYCATGYTSTFNYNAVVSVKEGDLITIACYNTTAMTVQGTNASESWDFMKATVISADETITVTGVNAEKVEFALDSLPVGAMSPYGNINPPDNWLVCDGSAVSRTEYKELFAVIGTSYGSGDGSTTFNLPNKTSRTSVGLDTSDSNLNSIGKKGGEKSHTLTINEMPSHSHRGWWRQVNGSGSEYVAGLEDSYEGETGTYIDATLSAGGSQAHNIMQPYEVDVWIIKAKRTVGAIGMNILDALNSYSSTDALSANQGRILNEKIEVKNVLFENESGVTSTLTLTDDSANYEYLEIYFMNYENYHSFVKVYKPNGKTVSLFSTTANLSDANLYKRAANAVINRNSITLNNNLQEYWYNGNRQLGSLNTAIKITRVIGIK